jgi:Di-haem oxidoreductase, putative peroxidase
MFSKGLGCILLLSLAAVAALTFAGDIDLNPIVSPPNPEKLRPVERVARDKFGVVGLFPLHIEDLESLVFPSTNEEERSALLEGLEFFSTPHTEPEGAGPFSNQRFCLGCHMNSADVLRSDRNNNRLVATVSPASRAARSTPTNFGFTSFNPDTGGGRAPDNIDALDNTGKTAAFTLFGDFSPSTHVFNALAQFSTGGVQRVRPSLEACLPDPIPSIEQDPNLAPPNEMGFRRTTGERAAPPYIGRGLIEAVFDGDILANELAEKARINSSLGDPADFPECSGDCVAGRHNENTSNQAFVGGHTDVRVGRLGLRAAGPTLMQFMIGGSNGELGFTSPLLPTEPFSAVNVNRPGCVNTVASPELPLSTPVSLRALMRLIAPPDFGEALLNVLKSRNPEAPWPSGTLEAKVQLGAKLFGIDLIAFSNRMIPGRMPKHGDGRNQHAINEADRKLNCTGCHTPIMATGFLPAEVGAEHVSNVWVPLFSDLLIHVGPNVEAERNAKTVRLPVLVQRVDESGHLFDTLDLARGTADDTLPNQGIATGREWRTPPLMGLGRIGPPLLHDGRVYLSRESVNKTPAGTVYSDQEVSNNPLVVRTLEDALRAAIELHDLPVPFNTPNQSTEVGGGCPLPPDNRVGDVVYKNGAADICPPYNTPKSRQNRSAARKVIKRWHSLTEEEQQAVIAFLEEL